MPTATTELMTLEDFLSLPDDGIERELIAGVLNERPMTKRNRYHAKAEASIAYALNAWRQPRPEPRGDVLSGEVGFTLRREPDSGVGIDVAYISPETAAAQSDDQSTMIVGVPVLAVEILSPSDKQEDITNKIDEYLEVGVKLIWIVDPHFRTVTVHRCDGKPEFFTSEDELTAEPHLPGFRVLVQTFFE